MYAELTVNEETDSFLSHADDIDGSTVVGGRVSLVDTQHLKASIVIHHVMRVGVGDTHTVLRPDHLWSGVSFHVAGETDRTAFSDRVLTRSVCDARRNCQSTHQMGGA